MANIYILTGSFNDYPNAWLKFNSPINRCQVQVSNSGSIEEEPMMVIPSLTEEEFNAGASTASVPYQEVLWDLYENETSYYENIKDAVASPLSEVSFMPNVSTASSTEIINYIQSNQEPFVSLSLVEIWDAS